MMKISAALRSLYYLHLRTKKSTESNDPEAWDYFISKVRLVKLTNHMFMKKLVRNILEDMGGGDIGNILCYLNNDTDRM